MQQLPKQIYNNRQYFVARFWFWGKNGSNAILHINFQIQDCQPQAVFNLEPFCLPCKIFQTEKRKGSTRFRSNIGRPVLYSGDTTVYTLDI